MPPVPINWLSIIDRNFNSYVAWFRLLSQSVFGKAWMDSLGITEEDIQKGNMGTIFGDLFCHVHF